MAASTSQHWLNAERLRVYPRIIVVVMVVVTLAYAVATHDGTLATANPVGTDFMPFYVASTLALEGKALLVYDLEAFVTAQHEIFPGLTGSVYGWFYPPTFLLLVLPFALLPHLASLALFVAVSAAAWWAALRKAIGRPGAGWLAIAFPGFWICVTQGQNGLLTAALAGGSLLLLKRHPALSGVLLGLLIIKPHLAALFAVALIAARAWRTLLVAAGTAAGFLALSLAVLGGRTLTAWFDSLQVARLATELGLLPWNKMPSTFAMLRLLGTPVGWAYAAHAVVAVAAAAVVWLVWRRTASLHLRGAALMTATFLANPYAFDYDLAWLAFPIAWLAVHCLEHGWRRGDREVLLAAWLLPAVGSALGVVHVQIGPFVLGALLWITLRRVLPVAAAEPSGQLSGELPQPG